jgi:hypothetical protein
VDRGTIDQGGRFYLTFKVPAGVPLGTTQLQFSPGCSHSSWMPFVPFTVTTGSIPPPPPPGFPTCSLLGDHWHCYVQAARTFPSASAHGVSGVFNAPASLAGVAAGDYSIGQVALESASAAIEFGWIVSPSNYGNAQPHIFLALRRSNPLVGTDICFLGLPNATPSNPPCPTSSYEQRSTVNKPGMLASSSPTTYHVGYFNGAWWVQYGNEWMLRVFESYWGSLPGTFSAGSRVSWFGETGYASKDCTPLGNGTKGSTTGSTSITNMYYETMRNGNSVALAAQVPTLTVSDSRYWDSAVVSRDSLGINGFRYGGPGRCYLFP